MFVCVSAYASLCMYVCLTYLATVRFKLLSQIPSTNINVSVKAKVGITPYVSSVFFLYSIWIIW